jgi:hypothetical protein
MESATWTQFHYNGVWKVREHRDEREEQCRSYRESSIFA